MSQRSCCGRHNFVLPFYCEIISHIQRGKKEKNVQNNSYNSDNSVINTQEIEHFNQPRFPEATVFLRVSHIHI